MKAWLFNLCVICVLVTSQAISADLIRAQNAQPSVFSYDALREATKTARRGDIDGARRLVDGLAKANDQPHPDILMTRVLSQAGRAAEGRRLLERLATKEPNRLDLKVVFVDLAVREGRWFDGITHARRTPVAQVPDSWSPEFAKRVRRDLKRLTAACLEGQEEWSACAELVSTLLKDTDDDPGLLASLARCEFHQGNPEAAIRKHREARRLDKNLEPPQLMVARMFDKKGDLANAEKHFKSAVEAGDDADRTRSALAFANWLIWNNRPQPVAELVSKPIADTKLEAQRRLLLGMAARMRGDFGAARTVLSRLAQDQPLEFAPANHLALVLIESDDEALRARSLQLAEANVRKHTRLAEAWATLGWVQFRLGDVGRARETLSRAMSSGNISRDTAWHLARIHNRLGNQKEEKTMLQAAESATGPFFSKRAASR